MTNREQLYENYEDALFAILMDDLAETEGERLLELNQQLQDDPDAAIPDEVRQRCIAVINREFAKKKRAASVQRAKKVLKILPWAVVIAMALMAVAMAAFPSFRAGVLNVLRVNASDNTTWRFSNSYSEDDNELTFYIDLPEEFIEEEISINPLIESADYRITEHLEAAFSIMVFYGENTVIGVDNKNYTSTSTISINGEQADLYCNETDIWITWANEEIPYVCTIESSNIDLSIIINIAKSFKCLK